MLVGVDHGYSSADQPRYAAVLAAVIQHGRLPPNPLAAVAVVVAYQTFAAKNVGTALQATLEDINT